MYLSVFDIFKIGVGPSSSHTMGPMLAAARFLDALRTAPREPGAGEPARIVCRLHGSLAFTGKGHATDRAVRLGLLGFRPDTADPDAAEAADAALARTHRIAPEGLPELAFDPERDLVFDFGPPLPLHPNGMSLEALDAHGSRVLMETYYSIGGGFVRTARELEAGDDRSDAGVALPYPFQSAQEMLAMGRAAGLSIAAMSRANEAAASPDRDLDAGLDRIWSVMNGVIDRGLTKDGLLPGRLKVRRRAKAIAERLDAGRGRNDAAPHEINDWICLYAIAVNEENAAGGRVVTAPTNGAAGTLPSVLRYWLDHCPQTHPRGRQAGIREFLLTAAAVGRLIKQNASISGAEVGCQGEVGSASAMAAAGLCAVLGGTNAQIENAAEIALEHHLGMTCDPAEGLVQVPCIERNALGAVKAVTAASLSLQGDGEHVMPLDNCIEAMRQTGIDMDSRYKETSQGGLAVNLPEC